MEPRRSTGYTVHDYALYKTVQNHAVIRDYATLLDIFFLMFSESNISLTDLENVNATFLIF